MTTATTAAARGTLLSIALRLLSFLLTQLTVRFVSASTLGKASIPLELLLATALFVGREGFRLGLTKEISDGSSSTENSGNRDTKAENQREQRIINVSWLSVPTGALLSICALIFHLYTCQNIEVEHEWERIDYKFAGVLYCLTSFVESLSEPLVISCLQRLDVATKAKAEGIALLFKGASCFGTLYVITRYDSSVYALMQFLGVETIQGATFSVTAFGISQLVYAMVFTCIMYHKAAKSDVIRWPKSIKAIENPYKSDNDRQCNSISQNLDLHTLYLVVIFTLQGVFKHALTEADKIVLSALAGSYDQGVYALASSYGGLAARLLLQALEENARLLFSRQGALIARNQEDVKQQDNCEELVQDLEKTYCFLLRGVLYIGLIFAAIATNYTSLLLRILAGNKWGSNSEASEALSAFCVYTAFLALNGTTEAFVYGVARSGKDVGQLGLVHAVIGGIFAIISPGLVRSHGAVGLVAANCICMGLRSGYSLQYASKYFASVKGLNDRVLGGLAMLIKIIPHPVVLVLYGSSFAITRVSMTKNFELPIAQGANWLIPALTHISVGVACVVVIVAMSLYLEDDIRNAIFKSGEDKSNKPGASTTRKSLSEWYMIQMEKHELLTKSITAGFLGVAGDIFAQGVEQHLDRGGSTTFNDIILSFSSLDKQRNFAMFCDGLFTGPLLHYIYEFYEVLLPLPEEDEDNPSQKMTRKRVHITIAHVLIDNIFMAFLYVFLTMCSTAIFEGHYETIPHELKYDYFSAVKASWTSSVGLAPMQLLSFLYLPKELKVLAVNVQDIVWVAMISYATHLNRH